MKQYVFIWIPLYIHLASQTWCLGRFLPLLVADMIPLDDENWENYLQLMKIMDYIFSPSTTEIIISTLRVLIEDFLHDFHNLYPERRITPKMHYLIHVPSWMLRYLQVCIYLHTYIHTYIIRTYIKFGSWHFLWKLLNLFHQLQIHWELNLAIYNATLESPNLILPQ